MGRPSSYRPEFAEQAEKLCRLGATDAEMADFFGVDERTINRWKSDHPEFCQSLKAGKLEADANVANRLYQRAMGYSHAAVKIAVSPTGEHHQVPYTEHYAPDTTAAIFWLKNRRPDQWREKQTHEMTGAGGAPLVPVLNVTIGATGPEPAPEAGPGTPDKRK
jgi:hypothetical protein